MEILPAYISKINSSCEKQIILLMIPNIIVQQKIFALLHGITSKHEGGSNCLNCFHSFRTENKLKSLVKVCRFFQSCNGIQKG